MRGKPLYPFAVTAVLGIILITLLSFVGLYQSSHEAANDDGENKEEVQFDDPIELGEHVYLQNCAACHGDNLEGMGGNPALNALEGKYTVDEILQIIAEGRGIMPAGLVEGEEAEAVANYLLSQSQ